MINIKKVKDECPNHDECQNQYILQGGVQASNYVFYYFPKCTMYEKKNPPTQTFTEE